MLRTDVHKHADAMVAFNYGTVVGAGETTLVAKYPLSIHYDGKDLDWSEPLQLAEVLRQSVIASVHLLGSPAAGSAFVMERMLLTVDDVSDISGDPVELHTRDDAAGRSNRNVTTVEFRRDGQRFASGLGHLRVVSRASYERLRGAGALASSAELPAATADAITLTRQGVEPVWAVEFNPRDEFFFDHPVDHVPGMLLFEAVMMAAVRVVPGFVRLAEFDGHFCRFIELDEDMQVELDPSDSPDRVSFRVTGAGGALAARGYVAFTESPS